MALILKLTDLMLIIIFENRKMHEELQWSVAEIEKARKFYFGEEHLAKQARDKEEKY